MEPLSLCSLHTRTCIILRFSLKVKFFFKNLTEVCRSPMNSQTVLHSVWLSHSVSSHAFVYTGCPVIFSTSEWTTSKTIQSCNQVFLCYKTGYCRKFLSLKPDFSSRAYNRDFSNEINIKHCRQIWIWSDWASPFFTRKSLKQIRCRTIYTKLSRSVHLMTSRSQLYRYRRVVH